MQEKKTAIVERWLEDILATYASDASSFLRRERDPFANPVSHAFRVGTRAIFENIVEGLDADTVCRHLNEIIKIRAIQDFSPSRAVSFVFLLKKAIRTELGNDIEDRQLSKELAEIDTDIDQIALFAFDIYSRCREQVYELRVNEVKRSVSALMGRFTGNDSDPESLPGPSGGNKSSGNPKPDSLPRLSDDDGLSGDSSSVRGGKK